MRAVVICSVGVFFGAGCYHPGRPAGPCQSLVCPGEDRGPPEEPAAGPTTTGPAESADCPPAAEPCPPARARPSFLDCLLPKKEKCPPKEKCKVEEIRVNVPPPKVIIRKEAKPPEAPPAPPPSVPSNEVLLVPRVVYVPYAPQTPTGPARMIPITTTPAPQQIILPPTPPPAAPPCAPPPCAPAGTPGAAAPPAAPPGVEELKRRCEQMEQKLDRLVEALNQARGGR